MLLFMLNYAQSIKKSVMILAGLVLVSAGLLQGQIVTNVVTPSPAQPAPDSTSAAPTASTDTNAPAASPSSIPVAPIATPESVSPPAPTSTPAPATPTETTATVTPPANSGNAVSVGDLDTPGWQILAALMTFGALGGFVLYFCGLTRARNCGHTSVLLLVGTIFSLIGYWMGGFAVQNGGVGDAHAAVAYSVISGGTNGLDHELGLMVSGHHWGLMGNSGFFLAADPGSISGITALFLGQAALLAIAVAAALGASLERGRLMAMAIVAFLAGTLIYPLFANWVWGGGWLAELGREYGLGHGFVDLAGAGVVHETAGTLALVIAVVLGPRHGRFGRDKAARPVPGHNVPFIIFGTLLLLLSWTATNAFAGTGVYDFAILSAGVAAVNTLLAAGGGFLASFFLAAWRKRLEPAFLCRGLLGGAVASCGCSAMIDPWAALVIGLGAGVIVPAAMAGLEQQRIDDPVGATAVHGACGVWGVLATGLFANGALSGPGLNGVDGPVRGLLFGGAWHQLAAQALGAAACFVTVFLLGYASLTLIQKIVGARVALSEENEGLDWTQTGALGYQGDDEPEEGKR
jgi:Amt family ammonium transporter